MSLLSVQDVSKAFGGVRAVNDVSLEVNQGSIVGLIGTNGAGKTTLFNIISGFLGADSGRVTLDGEDMLSLKPHQIAQRGLVRTFQTPIGFPKMTVFENMLVFNKETNHSFRRSISPFRKHREISTDIRNRISRSLDTINLGDKHDTWLQDLSAPDLKLLEFIRAIQSEPKILLLDEPAAGVNVALLEELEAQIRKVRDSGVTCLIVDHNVGFICSVCDYVYAMADGKLISQGQPEAVVQDPVVIECYIGSGGSG